MIASLKWGQDYKRIGDEEEPERFSYLNKIRKLPEVEFFTPNENKSMI